MTLMLETESHGEVESGFYATFTQFTRLGEHTFSTRHLCELVQDIARKPDLYNAQILGYDLDKFSRRMAEHTNDLIQILAETEFLPLSESQKLNKKRLLERQQGEIAVEDEIDLHNEGRMIPVKIADDERTITIGDYRVSALDFGILAFYLASGGFMGWMDEQKPEFSEPAINAIKNSQRQLYREIKNSGML